MKKDTQELHRALKNRHIQLIALGGAIGTGLFLGSAGTIQMAGPAVILSYAIGGFIAFLIMRQLGEMMAQEPVAGSFSNLAYKYWGEFPGLLSGWNYWILYVLVGMSELTAVAVYVQYWFPSIQPWQTTAFFFLLITGVNLCHVSLFGEMEFWFASIKIVAIVAIILAGIAMVMTGFTSSVSGHAASVSNLWEYGGWFPKGAFGFFAGFQIAMFAFVGIELIGTTAAEAKDPEVNLPKAINTIPFRIVFFYVFALVAIMCITPWSDIDPETSPFVHTFVAVGIPAAASIVNFVVLTSAASSANSGIYSTSRMLYGLSLVGVAPKAFGRLSSSRVPANGLLFSCLCLLIGASMLIIMPTIMAAFTVMTTISSVCFIFVWSMILYSYVVYRKRHPERHETSKFKLPGGVFSCWICWIFFAVVLVLLTFEADTRMAMFTTPIWFIILGIGYFMSHKNHVSKR